MPITTAKFIASNWPASVDDSRSHYYDSLKPSKHLRQEELPPSFYQNNDESLPTPHFNFSVRFRMAVAASILLYHDQASIRSHHLVFVHRLLLRRQAWKLPLGQYRRFPRLKCSAHDHERNWTSLLLENDSPCLLAHHRNDFGGFGLELYILLFRYGEKNQSEEQCWTGCGWVAAGCPHYIGWRKDYQEDVEWLERK